MVLPVYSNKYMVTQYNQMRDEDIYLLFTEERWSSLTDQKRLEALQEVECRMAARQGRKPCKIQAKSLEPGCQGVFDGQKIVINLRLLQYSRFGSRFGVNRECRAIVALDTIIHEGRHAFQRAAITGNTTGIEIPRETLQSWLVNTISYMSDTEKPSDFAFYAFQPLERDAREYAGRAIADIYRSVKQTTGKRDNGFEKGLAQIHKQKADEFSLAKMIVGDKEIESQAETIKEKAYSSLSYADCIQVPFMDTMTTLLECMEVCGLDDTGITASIDEQMADIRAIRYGEKELCDYMDGLDEFDTFSKRFRDAVDAPKMSSLDRAVVKLRAQIQVKDVAAAADRIRLDGAKSKF